MIMPLSKYFVLVFNLSIYKFGDLVHISLNMFYHTITIRLILDLGFNFCNQSFQVPTFIFPFHRTINLINERILLIKNMHSKKNLLPNFLIMLNIFQNHHLSVSFYVDKLKNHKETGSTFDFASPQPLNDPLLDGLCLYLRNTFYSDI